MVPPPNRPTLKGSSILRRVRRDAYATPCTVEWNGCWSYLRVHALIEDRFGALRQNECRTAHHRQRTGATGHSVSRCVCRSTLGYAGYVAAIGAARPVGTTDRSPGREPGIRDCIVCKSPGGAAQALPASRRFPAAPPGLGSFGRFLDPGLAPGATAGRPCGAPTPASALSVFV